MKITPLEIRQKTFEKNFRGYDKDEVNGYLLSLSQEWEKLMDENKELSIKLRSSEREVEKLREVENSLFKTLKTAEDTGANIMEQANKAAELHMRETELKAEAILNDAKNKARDTIEEAEMKAKDSYEEMESQVKAMVKLYHTLENLRDDLLSDIKAVTSEISEKVSRAQSQVKHYDVDQQLSDIRRSTIRNVAGKRKKQEEPRFEEPVKNEPSQKDQPKEPEVQQEAEPEKIQEQEEPKQQPVKEKQKDNEGGERSFFDEIE